MIPLALPSAHLVGLLTQERIIECGAGEGGWAALLRAYGGDVIAIDPEPRGPGVIPGSHLDLGQYADRLLLVVWPPDGTDLREWVAAWGGERLCIVGGAHRFTWPAIEVEHQEGLVGRKGGSQVTLGRVMRG